MAEERRRRSERERNRHYRYESSHEERTMEPETRNGIVCNAPRVNLRRTPEKADNVIKIVSEGDKVIILGLLLGYAHVRLIDGTEGYIHQQYCEGV